MNTSVLQTRLKYKLNTHSTLTWLIRTNTVRLDYKYRKQTNQRQVLSKVTHRMIDQTGDYTM